MTIPSDACLKTISETIFISEANSAQNQCFPFLSHPGNSSFSLRLLSNLKRGMMEFSAGNEWYLFRQVQLSHEVVYKFRSKLNVDIPHESYTSTMKLRNRPPVGSEWVCWDFTHAHTHIHPTRSSRSPSNIYGIILFYPYSKSLKQFPCYCLHLCNGS